MKTKIKPWSCPCCRGNLRAYMKKAKSKESELSTTKTVNVIQTSTLYKCNECGFSFEKNLTTRSLTKFEDENLCPA